MFGSGGPDGGEPATPPLSEDAANEPRLTPKTSLPFAPSASCAWCGAAAAGAGRAWTSARCAALRDDADDEQHETGVLLLEHPVRGRP